MNWDLNLKIHDVPDAEQIKITTLLQALQSLLASQLYSEVTSQRKAAKKSFPKKPNTTRPFTKADYDLLPEGKA